MELSNAGEKSKTGSLSIMKTIPSHERSSRKQLQYTTCLTFSNIQQFFKKMMIPVMDLCRASQESRQLKMLSATSSSVVESAIFSLPSNNMNWGNERPRQGIRTGRPPCNQIRDDTGQLIFFRWHMKWPSFLREAFTLSIQPAFPLSTRLEQTPGCSN